MAGVDVFRHGGFAGTEGDAPTQEEWEGGKGQAAEGLDHDVLQKGWPRSNARAKLLDDPTDSARQETQQAQDETDYACSDQAGIGLMQMLAYLELHGVDLNGWGIY